MSLTEAQIQETLRKLVDPNTGKDFVATRSARNIKVSGDEVALEIELGYPGKSQHEPIRRQIIQGLKASGAGTVSVSVSSKVVAHAVQRGVKLIPGIKNIIAVASGKGGVGKSTTAVNLALGLAAEGASVGMLDADIYGPSQPMMLGIAGRPESKDGKHLEPMENHGLQAISIGFMIDVDTPMVWRGPMVTQALEQLLKDTRWRELDYLVVDLPTPPLPEATAMMFLMPGISLTPRCTACATTFELMPTETPPAPAAFSAWVTWRRIGSCWLFPG